MTMKNRKEYDRLKAKERYDNFRQRKNHLVHSVFEGKCYLCNKSESCDHFHLHHLHYDPIESDYPKHSKSLYVRIKRLTEAENHPERFSLLCPFCHRLIESIKYKTKNLDINRLVNLIRT